MKKKCPLCQKQVLPIQGEYLFIDSFWLNSQDRNDPIPPTGYIHARCLSQSKWGSFWFERQRQHYLNNPGFTAVNLGEEGMLFKSARKRIESIYLKTNGVVVEVSFPLTNQKVWNNGLLITESAEFAFHHETEKQKEDITLLLRQSAPIPILKIAEILGLIPTLENEVIASQAYIQGSNWDYWNDEYHVTLNQSIFLPIGIGDIYYN